MAQPPFRSVSSVSSTLLGCTPQSFLRSHLSTKCEPVYDIVHISGDENAYLDPAVYQVHAIEFSFSGSPQSVTEAHHCYTNTCSLYALGLTARRITLLTQGALLSFAPAPPPTPPPPTQTPPDDRRSGTQKADDLVLLEQTIISSAWYASNALEPACGSPECPYLAEYYGVCGMSCYTAFVVTNPDGTFGCCREECSAYTARQIESVVKHQRTNHFNHKPFLCVPTDSSACPKRFSSLKDLQNHRRRCH